jgi:aryl-alcohol dehydrogenase-like predicted oxidoreductase
MSELAIAETASDEASPNTAKRVRLGRTDLEVTRIGIGCGNGINNADLNYAISRGVNYIFTSSDMHAAAYRRSWGGIRRTVKRGSARRDDIVLVGCSYVNDAEKLPGIVADHMMSWGADHLDVFQWGWLTRINQPAPLLDATDRMMRTEAARKNLDSFFRTVREVGAELRSRGYARYIGVSTHDRALAAELVGHEQLDVLMYRYNIAHRGAENDIAPALAALPRRPGTVVFNTLHAAGAPLASPPPGLPPGKHVPDQAELYRFSLDRNDVDVVLTGPATRAHVDAALDALDRPPLEPRKQDYLRKLGDLRNGRVRVATA